jgi:hypothetical protein
VGVGLGAVDELVAVTGGVAGGVAELAGDVADFLVEVPALGVLRAADFGFVADACAELRVVGCGAACAVDRGAPADRGVDFAGDPDIGTAT